MTLKPMLKRKPGLNTLKLLVQEEGQVQDVLGPIEEKLLGLMSQTVISGCPEVVEAGFGSLGEPAAPELDISDLVS
jgi:hypothetical protein